MNYLGIGVSCSIGTIFVISVVGKIASPGSLAAFTASVRDMRVLPPSMARRSAISVVAMEIAVCALLAAPYREARMAGLGMAAALLTIFAAAVVSAVRRGVREPCRCFGRSNTPLSYWHGLRNSILATISIIGAAALAADGSVQFGGALFAVLAGMLAGFLITVLDSIVELFLPVAKVSGTAGGVG
ncbi:MauE/DoxX family redox-associated membrane protein [Nocardia arthritidis]|nr:MauE/DoxX family redox-associated membrane protein [Nocardia arthritidis]